MSGVFSRDDLRPALRASVVTSEAVNVGVVAAVLAHDLGPDAADERARNIVQAVILGEHPFDVTRDALRGRVHPVRASALATAVADAWRSR